MWSSNPFASAVCLLTLAFPIQAFVVPFQSRIGNLAANVRLYQSTTTEGTSNKLFFAETIAPSANTDDSSTPQQITGTGKEEEEPPMTEQRRVLGSQELLMLPRQYGPNVQKNILFPQINHVSVAVLSQTPSLEVLQQAVDNALQTHPLLRAHVQGDGEPDKRIDLFQMVREGEPNPPTFVAPAKPTFSASDICSIIQVPGSTREDLTASWQRTFTNNLDDGSWCTVEQGPLWKLELHQLEGASQNKKQPCALVFTFNHAISDQGSVNRLIDQLIQTMSELENSSQKLSRYVSQDIPMALEDSVLGLKQRWSDVQAGGVSAGTLSYVAGKAAEGLKDPVILPDNIKEGGDNALGALSIIAGRTAGGQDKESSARKSTVQFRTLSKDVTSALLDKCRSSGVSMTNAMTAAVALTATDLIGGENARTKQQRNYKVLQSLDMRRFGECLDKGESVACMAGSMDLLLGPLSDFSGKKIRQDPTASNTDLFWTLAKEGKAQTEAFVESGGPAQAVRVFDFAMTIADLNNLVYLTSQSKDTKGRAYSAGCTNVGVYERQLGFQLQGESQRTPLSVQHGDYKVEDVFYATPHTESGCLYPVSGLTLNGEMKLTFNPVSPIVDDETNAKFADAYIGLLEAIATGKKTAEKATWDDGEGLLSSIPENSLTLATALVGAIAVASHGPAWVNFFQSLAEMKANVADPNDFGPALNFWIFFAVGHPILQPILWISDVLHGSPGPRIADLVPATFLAGNALVIWAVTTSKEIRNALNVAALAAFFTYVGAGLDGVNGLGDYNLALDDSYKGQIVKGCPAYEEVRQSSMDDFDLNKYQGLWYEQKFHDWTQFKEVYDTTLDIKLTEDGKGWIDDFAVKGPAPDSAKLSWDKSPVANGAHYFLFGRVDSKDPPGVLRESGFGVEFPNYIVDVKKDPVTGEYKEAIQFQCLERGGVRVFEGINFMSRAPTMTDQEMADMHSRAEKAGMYPYGASPEQMHTVARKLDPTPIDNSWQQMWHAIGFDRLLELLTESIEDGGR